MLINYQKFGFKTGLIHVYLKDGNIDEIAKKYISKFYILCRNSHRQFRHICHVTYKEGKELLNLIVAIKKMQGVEGVVWSKRVYQSPVKEN